MGGAPARRTVAFVDGQNLFHAARDAFSCSFPNYDVLALAQATCQARGWQLSQVRFYTGVPDPRRNPRWARFWAAKGAAMGRRGVVVYTRPLRYRTLALTLADGTRHVSVVGEEKGIDVRIALDVIRLAHRRAYDVGILFSQDQDLSEVAREIRVIAREQRRWIKLACAFPVSPSSSNRRGVNGTDWIKIERDTYDRCRDLAYYGLRT